VPTTPPVPAIASSPRTVVVESPRGGRGVFAAETIGEGEVVEVCPVLVVAADELEALNDTSLRDHWFGWGDDGDAAVAMGHGSFYNHADDPSCTYEVHDVLDALVIRTTRAVEAGEELTIDYTGGGVNELWFEPR
jgi:SET domain-containing protein